MFNKKRKIRKFKFEYGKSPAYAKKIATSSRTPKQLFKKSHPLIAKMQKMTILMLFMGILALSIYSIFFSNFFKITEIDLNGEILDEETLGEEIKLTAKDSVGKNIIFFNTDELKTKILNEFPELQEIKIEKDYPKTIKIQFSQYPLVANVVNESTTIKKSFVINSIGYAVKEDMESPNLPYIYMKSDEPVNPQTPVIEANKLRYILETIIYFEDKFGMKIKKVEYKKTARELHLLTERDFYIWLDIQNPSDEQLKKLKKALVKLDIYTENLEYIDLRIAGGNGDKIIYKRR
jgi:cell division septal protein FtsQ